MIPKNGEKFSKQTQNWDAYHPRRHSWGLPGPGLKSKQKIANLRSLRTGIHETVSLLNLAHCSSLKLDLTGQSYNSMDTLID